MEVARERSVFKSPLLTSVTQVPDSSTIFDSEVLWKNLILNSGAVNWPQLDRSITVPIANEREPKIASGFIGLVFPHLVPVKKNSDLFLIPQESLIYFSFFRTK